MKLIASKRASIRFAAILMLLLGSLSASAQYYMNIRKGDGTSVQYVVSEIDSVWFSPAPQYVDLGLSVKWATFNVGATAPEEAGDYFAWGEVQTKEEYIENNYKWYNGGSYNIIKYNATDNKTTLDLDDDVARVLWGGEWRMPTKDEFQELMDNCTWVWKENGYEVKSNKTDYADKSIFIPAAGVISGDGLGGVGTLGYYWTSSLKDISVNAAHGVLFFSFTKSMTDFQRYDALTVRPVCP
jgi:hypothetical protein